MAGAKIKLSIVIPAYNRAKPLKKIILSLVSQKYRKTHIEIIIVDDGSTDNTLSIIKPIIKKHREIRYIHQENKGPAAARNAGARVSKGSIIGFIDSDVIAHKRLIPGVLESFAKNINADGIEGRVVVPEGPVKKTAFAHYAENKTGGRWLTCNFFLKKKVFLKTGGFDERYRHPVREDTDFGFALKKINANILFDKNIVIYHPVYKSGYKVFLKNAFYGIYEPLLFKKYPLMYLKNLKWTDSWFFPVYYAGYYTLPLFIAFKNAHPAILPVGIILFILSYTISVYAVFRKKVMRVKDLFITLFFMLFIPYLRLFWVLAGTIKFCLIKNNRREYYES